MDATDVLVIGGGSTGAGTARDLAMRGIDVTLAESGNLASGTTGRSHALLHSGARYAENDPDGAAGCMAENRTLRDIAPHCLHDTGGVFLQLPGDDAAYFEEKQAACEELGIPVEDLSVDTLAEEEPVSGEVQRAVRVPDAVIDAFRLTVANAAAAVEHGARVLTGTRVTDITSDSGAVTGAVLRQGDDDTTIEADHVVNATGAWAGTVAAMADIDVQMQPTAGAMAVVDNPGLTTVLNRCRPPSDGDIIVPCGDAVVPGTTSMPVDDPEEFETPDAAVRQMLDEAALMLPALRGADVERTYWGVRPLYSPAEEAGRGGRHISRGFHLLDHAERDGVDNLTTIVGGKLTTYRRMAEAVGDHVTAELGAEAACRTADEPLPGAEDPSRLERYMDRFGPAPSLNPC